ncbi:DUF5317 family protein [Sedimentibacter sp.]|uniref:DUF5317 family protein n=1 Tax=Sedimentibacter sp. TaxID=1960295 RepID=UPI0028AF597D|nr:DUF5317 family protein [Sedimentibacter sp.]
MIPEIILFSVLSIILLIIKNKKIKFNDFEMEIKGYTVLIIMAIIEITAQFLFKRYTDNNLLRILSMHWTIYFGLFIVSIINFEKQFMKLMFLGILMNFTAIIFNDFKMPVYVSEILTDVEAKKMYLMSGQDLIHSLLTEDTKFKIFSDIITLPPPYPFPKTISIGDIFLLLGGFVFWQNAYPSIKQK